MKSFNRVCAQGDVYFRRVDHIPSTALPICPVEGHELIVTHSETGHHHVMVLERDMDDQPNVEMFQSADNPLIAWLKINRPTVLEHKRSYNTHESIRFEPGIIEMRRQRENAPEGWRRVAD